MFSAAFCYHRDDAPLARDLEIYLNRNLPLIVDHVLVDAESPLTDALESGLSRQSVVGFLSRSSWPRPVARECWERVVNEAVEQNVALGWAMAGECGFPALFRKSHFFDLGSDREKPFRGIRRWIATGGAFPSLDAEVEAIFKAVGDGPGMLRCEDHSVAARFVEAAGADFDFILRVDALGRSQPSVAAEICAGLGMLVSYPLEESVSKIREAFARRRGLLVIEDGNLGAMMPQTPRTSVLNVGGMARPIVNAAELTRQLEQCIRGRAEAPAFALLDRSVNTALASQCDEALLSAALSFFRAEYRVAEAEDLLKRMPGGVSKRFSSERFWVADAWGYERPPVTPEGQLALF